MTALKIEDVIQELRQLHSSLGRIPTQRQWVAAFAHSGNSLTQFGGFSAVVNQAFSQRKLDESRGMEPADVPTEDIPFDDLLAQRKQRFEFKARHYSGTRLIPVKIKIGGPICVAHFGDPHVDDDGCNISELERNKTVVTETRGMFAANVGDQSNNWIGRLARLYGQQSTSARDAWRLCEWFVGNTDWLYLVGGNHDAWSGDGDPLKWIIRTTASIHLKTSVRLALRFPNGREVRINARHDFPGNSMWNPAHGPMRAAQMGWRDHILTCGHRHVNGYGILKCPASGVISHAIRVSSYKQVDSYAMEKGFPDGNISPCVATIIDPDAQHERDLVQVFHSVDFAADYLKYLRRGHDGGRPAKGKK